MTITLDVAFERHRAMPRRGQTSTPTVVGIRRAARADGHRLRVDRARV